MSSEKSYTKSRALQNKAHALIPGGCHTYAKGDDQYPEQSPGFVARGHGCHVWDVDGNEFIEYGMGLRAVTLGHAYEPVIRAACDEMSRGSNFTRPSPIEVTCAESLLDILKGAEQVKFAKDGSTVVSAAVKLARAFTGRDMVAICADHPFFSYNDWFIGTTAIKGGIPAANVSLTLTFPYNNLTALKQLFQQYPNRIACVLLEAARLDDPAPGFLKGLQELCRTQGAVLIFDEMITGFRWDLGGAQRYYGVTPDLSTFGKAMANGFALSALVGRREIMELGGLQHEKERVFLLSTTHGAETHAMAAAIATMQVYRQEPVIEHLHRQGERLRNGVNQVIGTLGLAGHINVVGRACNLQFGTKDGNGAPSQAYRALFLQELIRNGVIAPSFVVSYSHTDADIDQTIDATYRALEIYRAALSDGAEKYLIGPPVKPVYRKFN